MFSFLNQNCSTRTDCADQSVDDVSDLLNESQLSDISLESKDKTALSDISLGLGELEEGEIRDDTDDGEFNGIVHFA